MASTGQPSIASLQAATSSSVTGCLLDDDETKRLTTDGRPLPGVELRLAEAGEIYSRGPDCCVGYTDSALTAAAFDPGGWYRTGDVGVLDDDGYLTITDRVSDIIIRGGENISAQEIEELLLGLDSVAEASVVAVPDDRLGERAAAVLCVREGMAAPTLEDSLVPSDSSVPSTAMISRAPQSKFNGPRAIVPPPKPNTSPR